MSEMYPPVSFYFALSLLEGMGGQAVFFKEVSGITMNMETEEISEGGNNPFIHRVPASSKYSNLVLKRGIIPKDSAIAKWCFDTLDEMSAAIKTHSIVVSLLDKKGNSLKSWNFVNAFPVKWTTSGFDAGKNEILVETLELEFAYFSVLK
ncbi:MAG: phage tail protein [Saprospiraceae bacterium]|nr:phage tail protein [Saprospiraceae bacterium]MCB9325374.1 phage tail protein [Lewinellaceae bacterium]